MRLTIATVDVSNEEPSLFHNQPGLAVNDLDGPFLTGRDALSATVAQFLVDFDDLPCLCHDMTP